jgi:hypothetical protein
MNKDRIPFNAAEVATYYRTRFPKLSQRGRQWRGPCPIHHGRDDNFAVDPASGLWICRSQCGRGADILDLEMSLTGADFKTALAAVYAIVGRQMPERARMTRHEWRIAREAHEREQHELLAAFYFAGAARVMAEGFLENLDPWDEERAVHTRLIEELRKDAPAVYRDCLERYPAMAAGLVAVGRARVRRLHIAVARYLMAGVSNAT